MAKILWLTLLALSFTRAQQACWYPDGQTASPSDTPCDPSAAVSNCCPPDSFCLANGLCFGGGIVSRGSCTDKSWSDKACGLYCLEINATSADFVPCYGDRPDTPWNCFPGTTIACEEYPVDTWDVVLRDHQVPLAVTTSGGVLDINPTAANTVSLATSSSTTTLPPTSPASTSPTPEVSHGSTDVGAIVGGAVGGFIGGLTLGAAGLYLFFGRKTKNRQSDVHSMEKQGPAEVPATVREGGYYKPAERPEWRTRMELAELADGHDRA